MIGIDIVSIDRIKKMHEKFGDKFYDRFLCEDEKEFIKKVKNGSYEVVATNNAIFYITKIDKKYYITLIDNLKTNCSNALIQAF